MASNPAEGVKILQSLPGSDFQVLSWHHHWALHVHLVCECTDILWRSVADHYCELSTTHLLQMPSNFVQKQHADLALTACTRKLLEPDAHRVLVGGTLIDVFLQP